MKTNKDSLRSAMDRRLSFLDELPSCRAGLYHRIIRFMQVGTAAHEFGQIRMKCA